MPLGEGPGHGHALFYTGVRLSSWPPWMWTMCRSASRAGLVALSRQGGRLTEHTTDSHGHTLATFALFDLVGLRLSPRIAKLTDNNCGDPTRPATTGAGHRPAAPHAPRPNRPDRRTLGRPAPYRRVTQTGPRLRRTPHRQAPGRLPPTPPGQSPARVRQSSWRTLHALRWFTDEAFRRRIGRQLNRGEALNDLRRFIFFANRGAVRYPHHDDQTTQAHCHTLVVNACVLSTTGYSKTPSTPKTPTATGSQATSPHQPRHFEAINPYGTLTSTSPLSSKDRRRPLRSL